MTHFPLRNGHQSIALVREIISVWKGRSIVILFKGEFPSQNENMTRFYVSRVEEFLLFS